MERCSVHIPTETIVQSPGLLAVALSMNIRAIAASLARIARAREALIALTVLLTLSIFVLTYRYMTSLPSGCARRSETWPW